jgi:hypothetical protein
MLRKTEQEIAPRYKTARSRAAMSANLLTSRKLRKRVSLCRADLSEISFPGFSGFTEACAADSPG